MFFKDLVSRANDITLQQLLRPDVLKLLLLLDQRLATPARLQDILLGLYHPTSLLRDRAKRKVLLRLLRPIEAENLRALLGLPAAPDDLNQLGEISISKNTKNEERLFSFFEVSLPQTEAVELAPSQVSCVPNYSLFSHQRVAAEKVVRRLKRQPYRVMLHMPTGAGKTRTAMDLIADQLRSQEPGLVIWLAQSEELCEQAASEFEKAWGHLGNRKVSVYRFWGANQLALGEVRDGIVVAGLPKVYSSILSNLETIQALGASASLVVIDEAHSAIADTYRLILDALLVHDEKTPLLGLTATPGRSWNDREADRKLATYFGNKKVTLEMEGYENPVNYLIDNGYLARPLFRPIMHDGGVGISESDLIEIQNQFEIPKHVLRRLAEDEQRNLKVITTTEQLAGNHSRILLFAATVEHSDLIASVLRARGFHANSVTSATDSFNRNRLIEEYKSDSQKTRILCNFGVLTTGFDAPRTSAAVIARPTQSLVLYSQMVGRALRGPNAGGNDTAEIVSIIDQDLPGFRSVSEAFENWEDVWEDE